MNFNICPICENEMNTEDYPDYICPQGCCHYEIDPQGDNVCVWLFHGKFYIIPLSENSTNYPDRDFEYFLEETEYWKEKRKNEEWELQKNFPKLLHTIELHREILKVLEQTTDGWGIDPIDQMKFNDKMRYISKMLVHIDLPFELKHGFSKKVILFLNVLEEKNELQEFRLDFENLRTIVNDYERLSKLEQERTTRSHPLMVEAEQWGEGFLLKANLLIEIIEKMSDEQLCQF